MSLVAYDSSDESSEEETNEPVVETTKNELAKEEVAEKPSEKLCLPPPKHSENDRILDEDKAANNGKSGDDDSEKIHFERLPRPKTIEATEISEEEDDVVLHKSEVKPVKKERGPVRITVPSLSDFKDVDEENEKKNKIMPSKMGTGLFALLPPPKIGEMKPRKALIPQAVVKKTATIGQPKTQVISKAPIKSSVLIQKASNVKSSLVPSGYDSNSEDEDETNVKTSGQSSMDFFSLSTTDTLPDIQMPELSLPVEVEQSSSSTLNPITPDEIAGGSDLNTEEYTVDNEGTTLVSNVINLSKEEILLKNKAEVGPKLPVPEQEYNIDREGNVAFDDKAIEYLCGRRGIKRKNKEIDAANIIEINGEDIKPDEREWLVKALTEEPVQRPVSMMGGVNSASKKKHQITYLAHQAKAMEMELKNQWAMNRMTRKQTQSKYGF